MCPEDFVKSFLHNAGCFSIYFKPLFQTMTRHLFPLLFFSFFLCVLADNTLRG